MKRTLWSVAALAIVSGASGTALAVPIDPSGLNPGDSVEGLGTLHPWLDISTSSGRGVALFEATTPGTYGAPNGGASVLNGGISALGGFGDIDGARRHDLVFTLAPGVTATAFSIRMLDHGDLNTARATQHRVTLEARNGIGGLVDSMVLSYTSDNAVNPRSGSAGDLFLTGDAVSALPGQPGNFTFALSGPGITQVSVLYAHNGARVGPSDPNIAFDNLNVDFEQVPEPSTLLLLLAGLGGLAWGGRRSLR